MALKKIDTPNQTAQESGISFNVSNGDLEALLSIKEKWGFKGEADVFRFALAVLKQAEKETVYVDQGGSKVGLTPSADLVETKE